MTDPTPRPLRAGDADRQRTSDVLGSAFAAGQLSREEYDERNTAAWTAVHVTDLADLVADLGPQPDTQVVPAASRALQPVAPATPIGGSIGLSLAVMSGVSRTGIWRAAKDHVAVAIMGGVEIDLREVIFDEPHSTLTAFAWWGGVEVIVPPYVRVQVEGFALMGGFGASGPVLDPAGLPPDAPVLTIRGLAIMGGVSVIRKGYADEAGGATPALPSGGDPA